MTAVIFILSFLSAHATLDKSGHFMLIDYSISEPSKSEGVLYVDILFHYKGETYRVARHRYLEPITSIVNTFPWVSDINILVSTKKENSLNISEEIETKTKSRKIKSQVKAILERFEGKERVKVNREVPVSYVSDKMEEITEYRRAHLKEYLAAIDSFMDSCRYHVKMEFMMLYTIDANELSALSKLEECLLKSRCSYFRALAADAIGWIEKAHNDRRAVPALRKALDDPVTEVKFAAAKALWRLGEDGKAFDVLVEIAKGVGKENWTADWYAYRNIVDTITIEKLKNAIQKNAIVILGKMKTKESISVLQEIAQHNKEKWARDLASNILKNMEAGKNERNR